MAEDQKGDIPITEDNTNIGAQVIVVGQSSSGDETLGDRGSNGSGHTSSEGNNSAPAKKQTPDLKEVLENLNQTVHNEITIYMALDAVTKLEYKVLIEFSRMWCYSSKHKEKATVQRNVTKYIIKEWKDMGMDLRALHNLIAGSVPNAPIPTPKRNTINAEIVTLDQVEDEDDEVEEEGNSDDDISFDILGKDHRYHKKAVPVDDETQVPKANNRGRSRSAVETSSVQGRTASQANLNASVGDGGATRAPTKNSNNNHNQQPIVDTPVIPSKGGRGAQTRTFSNLYNQGISLEGIACQTSALTDILLSSKLNPSRIDNFVRDCIKNKFTFASDENELPLNFLKSVENLSHIYGLSEEELLMAVPRLISGRARTLYSKFWSDTTTWVEFCKIVKSFTVPSNHQFQMLERIKQRLQGPNEHLTDFINSIESMTEELDTVADEQLQFIITSNVLPEVRPYLIALNPQGLKELHQMAPKIDQLVEMNRVTRTYSESLMTNEKYGTKTFKNSAPKETKKPPRKPETVQVNEVQVAEPLGKPDHKPKREITCYSCGVKGHMSYDCPDGKRAPVCNRCKVEGHRSFECPNYAPAQNSSQNNRPQNQNYNRGNNYNSNYGQSDGYNNQQRPYNRSYSYPGPEPHMPPSGYNGNPSVQSNPQFNANPNYVQGNNQQYQRNNSNPSSNYNRDNQRGNPRPLMDDRNRPQEN